MLIHLDQVDYAGHHEGGPRDPRWNAAATRADALLEQIAGALDFKQDTLIVLSDHGQIDRGGHGGQDPITLVEPFVMVGAGVKPGQYPDMQMVDVAPTIAVLLGTNIPASRRRQAADADAQRGPARQALIQTAWSAQQAGAALCLRVRDRRACHQRRESAQAGIAAAQAARNLARGCRASSSRWSSH